MQNATATEHEIEVLLKQYFDGLYYGDTTALRQVFHPQAELYGDVPGARLRNSVESFLSAVAARSSPHGRGEKYRMEVLGMEVMNPAAYVKARCPMLGGNYHDYLALIREQGRWLITNRLMTRADD